MQVLYKIRNKYAILGILEHSPHFALILFCSTFSIITKPDSSVGVMLTSEETAHQKL